MPNSYEREPLFQNNGERLFFTQLHSELSLHPTTQRLLLPRHPFAPNLLPFTNVFSFYATMVLIKIT